MRYLSTREAAAQWDVTPRQVQRLLHAGRIPGAKKQGVWLIPANAEKPLDPRLGPERFELPEERFLPFPILYIHSGDLSGAYARCQTQEERALMDAYLAFFRADIPAARALAQPLYQKSDSLPVKLGSGAILAMCAVIHGDAAEWKQIVSQLSALPVSADMKMERELTVAWLNAVLHGRSGYPEWIETGAFTGLNPDLFPVARWTYTKIFFIKWRELELLAVAEPLIAECRREKSDLCEIYLLLLAAMAHVDHGNPTRAKIHIQRALDLALPLGLIQPLMDSRRSLSRLMDACLKERSPETLAIVKKQERLFIENWTKVYNSVWPHPMADKLTLRENEACSLYSRGMETREIARRMGISPASVKRYLNAAYNKLGIRDKSELNKYIHS